MIPAIRDAHLIQSLDSTWLDNSVILVLVETVRRSRVEALFPCPL